MQDKEKTERLISPENFYPKNLKYGNLFANDLFIEPFSYHLEVIKESQYWPLEKLKFIQLERLKKLLTKIRDVSSFWRKFFSEYNFDPNNFQSLNDFSKLPIISRKKLLEWDSDVYRHTLDLGLPIFDRTTSGTTGVPLRMFFEERELIMADAAYFFRHEIFKDLDVKKLLYRKFMIVLGGTGMFFVTKPDFIHENFKLLSTHELDDKNLRNEIYKKIIEAGPALLIGFSSMILKFAQCVEEDKISLPLLGVRLAAEPMSLPAQEYIEETLGAPIFDVFSSNGIGQMGFRCPSNKNYFHLNLEKAILEVVDDNGHAVKDGEMGSLVVSSLDYTATPILRYSIDDIGRIKEGKCICKRTLPFFDFSGRKGEELITPSGRRIRILQVLTSIRLHGIFKKVSQFQIKQEAHDNIKILVIRGVGYSDADDINFRLSITELLNNEKINIEIEHVESIPPKPNGKSVLFVPL